MQMNRKKCNWKLTFACILFFCLCEQFARTFIVRYFTLYVILCGKWMKPNKFFNFCNACFTFHHTIETQKSRIFFHFNSSVFLPFNCFHFIHCSDVQCSVSSILSIKQVQFSLQFEMAKKRAMRTGKRNLKRNAASGWIERLLISNGAFIISFVLHWKLKLSCIVLLYQLNWTWFHRLKQQSKSEVT